jgi:hypothetical protein
MERVKGIEPSSQPWEGHILPLNHTRFASSILTTLSALTSLKLPRRAALWLAPLFD